MPREDIPIGRIELETRPLRDTLNRASERLDLRENREAIEENRKAIEELRRMLQAIIDHLGVPYVPNADPPED